MGDPYPVGFKSTLMDLSHVPYPDRAKLMECIGCWPVPSPNPEKGESLSDETRLPDAWFVCEAHQLTLKKEHQN